MLYKYTQDGNGHKAGDFVEIDPSIAGAALNRGWIVPAPEQDIRSKAVDIGYTRIAEQAANRVFGLNGKKSFGHYLSAMTKPNAVDVLPEFYADNVAVKAAMYSGSGITGGYAIPVDYLKDVIAGGEPSSIREGATIYSTKRREFRAPYWDVTTPQSAGNTPFTAGFQPIWTTEGTTLAECEPAMKLMDMKPTLLAGQVVVNNAWLADITPATLQSLFKLFGYALSWFEEYAFLQGNGVGKPQGILGAPATKSITRATGGKIQYADIGAMLAALLPESINRFVWLASPSALPQLLQLTDGTGRAAVIQVGGFAGGPQFSLAGRPLVITEKLSALGTKGDLMAIDRRHYSICDHVGAEQNEIGASRSVIVAFSAEASQTYFTKNQSVFIVGITVDGRPWLDNVITLQDGATTVSPFVVLN
jgi:HK97 family phage major capsid protein